MSGQLQALKNGVLIFILIGLYFLLLEALGLADNLVLRFVNFIFVFIGVNNVLRYKAKQGATYLGKLKLGILTVFIGIALSAIAFYIYLVGFEKDMSAYAMTLIPAKSPAAFAGTLFVEGFTSSLIIVFILLQYYKNVNTPEKEQ